MCINYLVQKFIYSFFTSNLGDVSRLVVVITDGKHTKHSHGYSDPTKIARHIRQQGADLLVVAVGQHSESHDRFLGGIAGTYSTVPNISGGGGRN